MVTVSPEKLDKERQRLRKAFDDCNLPEYMANGIIEYIVLGRETGDFLYHLIENDLKGAVTRADVYNAAYLSLWVKFLFNHAPGGCWGFEGAYSNWVKKGGLQYEGQTPDQRRHQILGLDYSESYPYDIKRFDRADADQVQTLIKEGFLDPNDCADGPEAQEILEFLKANPKARAEGYIVTPDRIDSRVTLDGVNLPDEAKKEDLEALMALANQYPPSEISTHRIWWD